MLTPSLLPLIRSSSSVGFHMFLTTTRISTRKLLAPLLIKIHPDMFGQEEESVKNLNMSCVQSINNMWSGVEKITTLIDKSTENIHIEHPLESTYKFRCYIRFPSSGSEEMACEPEKTIRMISFALKTPDIFSQRRVVARSLCERAMNEFLVSFGGIFTHAGLENPWMFKFDSTESASAKRVIGLNSSWTGKVDKDPMFRRAEDIIIFERTLQNRRILESGNIFDQGSRRNGKREQTMIRGCVDTFIQRQNVMVKSLSPRDEFVAVQRLREFLLEYAAEINFSAPEWQKVVFVVYEQPTKAVPERARNKSDTPKDYRNDGAESVVTALGKAKQQPYGCSIRMGRTVIQVPHNFKAAKLLDCLIENVPAARSL